MTLHIRTHALIGTAAVIAIVLAGCSTSPTQSLSSSPTPTRTSSPTTSVDVARGPAVVGPPSTAAQAITEANKSLIGYYSASFASGHAGGTEFDLVRPWVTGSALRNEQILSGYLREKQYRLEGLPTGWTLNARLSSAAESRNAGHAAIALGAVRLVGCAKSTNHPVGTGAPAWTTRGSQFKRVWSVLYDQQREQWIVAAAVVVQIDGTSSSCF